MSMWTKPVKIKHQGWMPDATRALGKNVELYRTGRLPKSIESAMLVVPMKRVLRAIYGSDLRAALALLRMAGSALLDELRGKCWCRVRMKSPEADLNKLLDRDRDDDLTQ